MCKKPWHPNLTCEQAIDLNIADIIEASTARESVNPGVSLVFDFTIYEKEQLEYCQRLLRMVFIDCEDFEFKP